MSLDGSRKFRLVGKDDREILLKVSTVSFPRGDELWESKNGDP